VERRFVNKLCGAKGDSGTQREGDKSIYDSKKLGVGSCKNGRRDINPAGGLFEVY